jgi:iron only hydrogenase large subunit-like protein
MNHNYPVYTIENECQDCCKCVRHCPSKAIRVVNGSASVIPELCVACGLCVKICPAGAKQIRCDLSRAKFIISGNTKVIASIAPSWVNNFKNYSRGQLITALKKIGFYGVSETALGAQLVSAETAKMMREGDEGVYISSACPAAVDYISKYLPEYTGNITGLMSPLLTHCRMLRNTYGEDIKIIFFGPCAAKKQEADRHPDLLNLALTFDDLAKWLKEEKIKPENLDADAEFIPEMAEEGRMYPIEGGMIETLRAGNQQEDKTYYLTVSGLHNIERVLQGERPDFNGFKIFIECLACEGGCVNGPAMHEPGSSLAGLLRTAVQAVHKNSIDREVSVELAEKIDACVPHRDIVGDEKITAALASVGKYNATDELNCGGCGYQTCRAFARAMVEGKAEPAMCLSYLRKLAQKKSNALIKYIPSGVVIADNNMNIIECNEAFSKLFDESTRLAFEAVPGLAGVSLDKIIDFTELFEAALASGKDVCRNNYINGDKILNISVFTIESHRIIGAIVQDVTQDEMHREHIAEKAQEVIRKNVITVQKIAKYLGEHMADTEILLHEVATGYHSAAGDKKGTTEK